MNGLAAPAHAHAGRPPRMRPPARGHMHTGGRGPVHARREADTGGPDALRGHARATPATGRETNRPPAGRFCFALFTPSPCPAGVASSTTRQPCSRATIWPKQNQNRLKTRQDICMRDISRGEGNLKSEGAGAKGISNRRARGRRESQFIISPKILVVRDAD